MLFNINAMKANVNEVAAIDAALFNIAIEGDKGRDERQVVTTKNAEVANHFSEEGYNVHEWHGVYSIGYGNNIDRDKAAYWRQEVFFKLKRISKELASASSKGCNSTTHEISPSWDISYTEMLHMALCAYGLKVRLYSTDEHGYKTYHVSF